MPLTLTSSAFDPGAPIPLDLPLPDLSMPSKQHLEHAIEGAHAGKSRTVRNPTPKLRRGVRGGHRCGIPAQAGMSVRERKVRRRWCPTAASFLRTGAPATTASSVLPLCPSDSFMTDVMRGEPIANRADRRG
jgi:hypothetical protein